MNRAFRDLIVPIVDILHMVIKLIDLLFVLAFLNIILD